MNIFVTSTTVVHIEFVIKKLWLHDSQCQNQPHDSLMLTKKARWFLKLDN